MITFGSLFSGIGGLDLGLERAGMACKWQVEIDDYATRVLERHWPDVRRWRDIHDFIADAKYSGQQRRKQVGGRTTAVMPCEDLAVDLICGGFPCQPVSVAGNQRGDRDERWLWDQFREVVEILRPRVVLAENVPGLLSADSGRLFGNVLGDLAALGFDAEWGCIPASAFDAPHQRFRVFIIAYRKSDGRNEGGTKSAGQFRGSDVAQCGPANGNANQSRLEVGQSITSDPRPQQSALVGTSWRSVEPTIRRGNHGVSNRVDRLRCLGNAVVPQVAEWLGRRIMELDT